MDRPSQEPAAQPDGAESPLSFPVEAPRPAGPEPGAGAPQAEPLQFPAEAPRREATASVPGMPEGEPLQFPAEAARPEVAPPVGFEPGAPQAAPLQFPTEVPWREAAASALGMPEGEPLQFPAEAARPEVAPPVGFEPGAPQAAPLQFPAEAPRREGTASAPGMPEGEPLQFPAEAAPPVGFQPGAPQAAPLQFPAEAPRPEATPLGEAPPPPGPPPTELPYPVAHIPGAATTGPPPPPAAAPAAPPAQAPAPPPSLLRFAPPALALVAALMTALGAFLPLFRIREHLGQRFLDTQMLITETAWGHSFELPDQEVTDQPGAPVGIPLLFAVVLLVAAALVAFTRPDHRLGRWLLGAGAFFAAGVVATVGTSGIGWSVTSRGDDLTVDTGPGMWLLIGGTVAAGAAAVLACLPRRQPSWADPALAYADTPTPPSGVAITVLPPGEPDDQQA